MTSEVFIVDLLMNLGAKVNKCGVLKSILDIKAVDAESFIVEITNHVNFLIQSIVVD